MIEQMRTEISHLFPLLINEADYQDPTLSLSGINWSFGTVSSWRVVRDGILVYGWSDELAPAHVQQLCGTSITSVVPQSPVMRGDPTFVLSNGGFLEIFADHPVDPWSFTVPGMTYIGSPSDPRYTQ
jgi:hypothetical protein